MNQAKQLSKAIAVASHAHRKQVDKGDQPYILHPLRVMNNVHTLYLKTIAVLHDVVEDTDCTLDKLLELKFDPYIVNSLDCLTFRKGKETKIQYLSRILKDRNACLVKVQDSTDNLDILRLNRLLTIKDLDRINWYIHVIETLQEEIDCG